MFEAILNERQHRIDRVQLIGLTGLMLLGTAFVYSATRAGESADTTALFNQMWVRQIVWYVAGIAVATALCFVDYHTLARWSFVFYWVMIILLIAVFIIGTKRSGASRWFDLHFFKLQPSEFASEVMPFCGGATSGFAPRCSRNFIAST